MVINESIGRPFLDIQEGAELIINHIEGEQIGE